MTLELKSYVFKTKIKNQWLSEQTFAQLDFWPTTWNSPCDNLPHPVLLMWCPWTLNLWPPVVALDINGPSSPEFMTRNQKQQDVAEAVVQLQQGSKWTQQCHCCFRSTQTPSFLSMTISYNRHKPLGSKQMSSTHKPSFWWPCCCQGNTSVIHFHIVWHPFKSILLGFLRLVWIVFDLI